MRKIFLILIIAIITSISKVLAQNEDVLVRLQQKYSLTRYRPECGGWYLLGYSINGTNFYGFADKEGNVIATNAVKYNVYDGFIELEILDGMKKDLHDRWIEDKKQYDKDYQTYLTVEKKYENDLNRYNAQVEAAKREAENEWKQKRSQAYEAAVRKYRYEQSKNSGGGGILGAVLNAVGETAAGNNAANNVEYQPIEDRIRGARGLNYPPSKPYNPKPKEPKEPSTGYEWKTYTLRQPCPYSFVEFQSIKDSKGIAIVKKSNLSGLVNSSLDEILPCEYTSIKKDGNNYILKKNGKIGLANNIGNIVIPCQFDDMNISHGYILCKKGNLWGIYTTSFEELYACQFTNAKFDRIAGKLVLFAQSKGLWGAYDFNTGKQILPFSYSNIKITVFGNTSCFEVMRNNNIGLYTYEGMLLIPCEFSSIALEKVGNEDMIKVTKGNKVGLYTNDGIPVIDADKYSNFSYISDLGFIVEYAGKKGLLSNSGLEILPCIYEDFKFKSSPFIHFYCTKDGMKEILTTDGKALFQPINGSIGFTKCYDKSLGEYHYMSVYVNGKYTAISYDGTPLMEAGKYCDYKKLDKNVIKYLKKNKTYDDSKYNETINKAKQAFDDVKRKIQLHVSHRYSFSFYAQNYVERIINDWQKKGEFEKMTEWKKRVNEETRQQKVFELTKEAQEQYITIRSKQLPKDNLSIVGAYDPDNETYKIKTDYSHTPITVQVPTSDAEEFKNSFSNLIKSPKFSIENNYLGLSEYYFLMPSGQVYKYRNDLNLRHAVANVEYNFDKIDLDSQGKEGFSTTALTLGTSDVDVKIPTTNISQEKTFAVIIANEKYDNEKNVEFAYNDGVIFKEYCIKALGLPASNVHFVANAGLNQMRQQFNWIKMAAEDMNGEAQFLIYYAGHGVPDDATKDAYLLPSDAVGTDLESAYKLSKLYDMLGEIPAKNVLVLLDACFSGAQRNGDVLGNVRGVAIKPQIDKPKGNVVVFSATTNAETAHPYKEKVHGLFTYFILKKLQEADGVVDLGNLSDYVTTNVSQHAISKIGKPQHPTISTGNNKENVWRNTVITTL